MSKSPCSFDPGSILPYQRFGLTSPSRKNGFISAQKLLLCRPDEETDSRACDRVCRPRGSRLLTKGFSRMGLRLARNRRPLVLLQELRSDRADRLVLLGVG